VKILHITNNYPTSNHPIFGIFVKEQIDSLKNLNIESEVFFINGREKGKKEYFSSIKRLRKRIKNNDYDILHCHHVFSAILLLLVFKCYKAKKIISYQNPPKKEGGILLFFIIRFFFNAVILKNTKLKSNKIFYLPNGVNLDFFKPHSCKESINLLKLDKEKKYILFMDSYDKRKQKRVDRFDEVIEILLKNGNPYNIEPLKLTNVDRKLIPLYLSASSVHIITSDFEGSPNSVKESMACNTPVVSTPVGNIYDLIGDVDGCYIAKSFDSIELAKLVIKSLNNEDSNFRQILIDKKYDIKSVSKNLKNIYKSIIS